MFCIFIWWRYSPPLADDCQSHQCQTQIRSNSRCCCQSHQSRGHISYMNRARLHNKKVELNCCLSYGSLVVYLLSNLKMTVGEIGGRGCGLFMMGGREVDDGGDTIPQNCITTRGERREEREKSGRKQK